MSYAKLLQVRYIYWSPPYRSDFGVSAATELVEVQSNAERLRTELAEVSRRSLQRPAYPSRRQFEYKYGAGLPAKKAKKININRFVEQKEISSSNE